MPRVALTFDDGPGPATTALLDVLAARGVTATFFLLGKNVERAIQGSLEQGLLRKPLRLEDVYYRTTLNT